MLIKMVAPPRAVLIPDREPCGSVRCYWKWLLHPGRGRAFVLDHHRVCVHHMAVDLCNLEHRDLGHSDTVNMLRPTLDPY